ncbi:hypothetical protein TPHA_0D00590 [Tetrapisispora phaffii CBS 4417]|uniref:Proteasome activator Blm10 mid region domain-containing protein n=1 Tax=Tetrapisispora phaffii (strain ATCC 24235 / CBS 4417 / NBRC 1672 / NRRL Y-8282 / UCD 70-5) TaxID=1071381 RepID=G8BS82_TETPH|nr:hypothetical protein TPHA_0D00590 [Tetrapisispora phaffii CBS 4417]CCE62703.1 hypothetical protein TPHA_0D00590 [Tetrapisispora phaffii CBS 4417]
MDSDSIFQQRIKYYDLDFDPEKENHLKNIFDPKSKWFSRNVKPLIMMEDNLPYTTETHTERAKYLCHILVNLYIAISSLDIQGLVNISSKDLAEFKNEVDSLELNSDFFSLSYANDEISHLDLKRHFNPVSSPKSPASKQTVFSDEEIEQSEAEGLELIDMSSSGKITNFSATIISVNHWTNELRNCLKFNIPLSLRKKLVIVFYQLSLVQGQKISRHIYIEMFEFLSDRNNDGTDFTELLYEDGLRLDHIRLYNFLFEFLPTPDSDYVKRDLSSKEDLNLFKLLLRLADDAKIFFDETNLTLMKDSMDKIISSLAPSTMSIILPLLTSSVPFHYNEMHKITDYSSFMYSIWNTSSPNVAIDTHLYDFIGNLAEYSYWNYVKNTDIKKYIEFDRFGIFNESQLDFMFNRIQGHLKNDFQIHSQSRTIRPLIYAINGSSNELYFEKLEKLSKSLVTYVHPSNNGHWTKLIAKFVQCFIKFYHKRYTDEEKVRKNGISNKAMLNEDTHEELVRIFTHLLNIGSQNKNEDVSNYYISSYTYLLDLNPPNSNLIYDHIILELYDAFSGEYINSKQRIITSIKKYSNIMRFMVMEKLYRVHITNIFVTLISKLDYNDLQLSNCLIKGIIGTATFIPLEVPSSEDGHYTFESYTLPFIQQHYEHLKFNADKLFYYEAEFLDMAYKGSSTIIQNSLQQYIEKIFQFFTIDIEDTLIMKMCNTTMIIIESMSDDMFEYFSKVFQKSFWSIDDFGEKSPNNELLTIQLAALVKRDHSLSKKLYSQLSYNIKEQIQRGAGSVRSASEIQQRDFKLVLYLTALNDILRQSHSAILDFHEELLDFLKELYKAITNPPVAVITSILIHSILTSLTITEIIDFRQFSEFKNISYEEKWGAYQFNNNKFLKDNLNFKWHIPSDKEVSVAIDFFDKIFDFCKSQVEIIITSDRVDSKSSDIFQKYLLVTIHAISGISILFDPDFNRNKSKPADELTYKEKLLLVKNLNENNLDGNELDIDVEAISSNKGEDYFEIHSGDESSGIVEVTENLDQLIMEDNTNVSEPPTTFGTPVIGASNNLPMSSLSSSISFRDVDIYSFNYFFGNTIEEKFSNKLYFHIHNTRDKVGKYFHKLYLFLTDNFENYTTLFQTLLHGMKVWITDVGKETVFNEDPSALLDWSFNTNIQSISHRELPYTRTCIALEIDQFHKNRVLSRSTNRRPSKVESKLLKDIFLLSISVYPDIYKPAQSALAHCTKQIIGSYSFIINTALESLKLSITENDYMKTEVILKTLMIKKIHYKLMTDYKNIEVCVMTLLECCKIEKLDIAMYGNKILTDVVNNLKIPSSVCIYDEHAISCLAPPDNSIQLQIDTVKKAKNKKRELYISLLTKLQNQLIELLRQTPDSDWKRISFIIKFVTSLQSNLQVSNNKEFLLILFEKTKSTNPHIMQLSIKSILRVINKIFSLSDYDYNISKASESTFDPHFFERVATISDEFNDNFRNEMNNFDKPSYFIDSKMYNGWICWGNEMRVMKQGTIDLKLNEYDFSILRTFSELMDVEWFKQLVIHFIQENEAKNVISSAHVSLFYLVIYCCTKLNSKIELDEILKICEDNYKPTDKASMVLSLEIFSSLIYGSKYFDEETNKKCEGFIETFIKDCLENDLNSDAFSIWSTVCWWLPTVSDIRRTPAFYKIFSDITILREVNSERMTEQTHRIIMYKNILTSLDFRCPSFKKVFDSMVFDHPYDNVRQSIAKLLSTMIQNSSNLSLKSTDELIKKTNNIDSNEEIGIPIRKMPEFMDKFIRNQFKEITKEQQNITNLTPQLLLKSRFYYLTSTMVYLLREILRGPNKILFVPYLMNGILPFLIEMMRHKDMCKLANINPTFLFIGIAYLPITNKSVLSDMIDILCSNRLMLDTSLQIQLKLKLIEHFYSSNLLNFGNDKKNLNIILNYIANDCLFNEKFVEVRIEASKVLSDIIHNLSPDDTVFQNLINKFDAILIDYNKDFRGKKVKERKEISQKDIRLHGSILGIGSFISAFPYAFPLPKWIPEQLSLLSYWARVTGSSGTSAKDIIGDFKKLRTDTWEFDRASFTNEQLEDLEGVLWRSYYA